MTGTAWRPLLALSAPLLIVATLVACGGGGGNSTGTQAAAQTTFKGNVVGMTALLDGGVSQSTRVARRVPLDLVSSAFAADTSVKVCIGGTAFCDETDADGFFVLVAPVSGHVLLTFTGAGFALTLELDGIPAGAVVTIINIQCNPANGRCRGEDVEVEPPINPGDVNQPPECSGASASPLTLFPPNHAMVPLDIAGVFDPDGDDVLIHVTGVFQDEPVLGTGSGDTSPDASLGPLAVRAERSGGGNGRVYTIEFTADDGRGGLCDGSVQVCVPHDQGQGSLCVDDGPQFDSLAR